jgi:hypothetical protein
MERGRRTCCCEDQGAGRKRGARLRRQAHPAAGDLQDGGGALRFRHDHRIACEKRHFASAIANFERIGGEVAERHVIGKKLFQFGSSCCRDHMALRTLRDGTSRPGRGVMSG